MEDQDISIFPEYTVTYANFWQRFAAAFLDGLILFVPDYFIKYLVGGDNDLWTQMLRGDIHARSIYTWLLQIAVQLLYFALMESSPSHATVGKQALGLQVTTLSGETISFARSLGRNFGKNLSVLTIFVGYFMMLWDSRSQTLHDKMAGTLVIRKQPAI